MYITILFFLYIDHIDFLLFVFNANLFKSCALRSFIKCVLGDVLLFMSFFDFLQNRKRKEELDKLDKETANIAIHEVEEKNARYGIERLKKYNLTKPNFSVVRVRELKLWPDDLLKFIQVNRLAYLDLMQTYSDYSNKFDESILNIVSYFKTQKNIKEVNEFLKIQRRKIPNNYWTALTDESNCYMYQIEGEDRERSSEENKHYRLLRAIRKCISNGYDDPLLKGLLILFDLRQAHSQVDEFVRKLLFEFIENHDVVFDIYFILSEMKDEMNEQLLNYSDCNDEELITKLKYFIDILGYICYKMLIFEETFQDNPKNFDEVLLEYTPTKLKSIGYVYTYFWERVESKDKQTILFKSGSGFNTIYNVTKIATRSITKTPKYLRVSSKDESLLLDEEVDPEIISTRKRKNSSAPPPRNPARI